MHRGSQRVRLSGPAAISSGSAPSRATTSIGFAKAHLLFSVRVFVPLLFPDLWSLASEGPIQGVSISLRTGFGGFAPGSRIVEILFSGILRCSDLLPSGQEITTLSTDVSGPSPKWRRGS